jgi:hypothetical protein
MATNIKAESKWLTTGTKRKNTTEKGDNHTETGRDSGDRLLYTKLIVYYEKLLILEKHKRT